jgi:type II secretory pathway pseudopilin PulG
MMAMCIAAMLIVVLSISLGAQRRAERRLNDQLLALRQAEATLATLQSATTRPSCGIPSNTQITPVSPGWSRVTVTINRASATLIGPTEQTP